MSTGHMVPTTRRICVDCYCVFSSCFILKVFSSLLKKKKERQVTSYWPFNNSDLSGHSGVSVQLTVRVLWCYLVVDRYLALVCHQGVQYIDSLDIFSVGLPIHGQ